MAARIKAGDTVYIRSGASKGQTGKVLKVFPDKDMVLIEGVNVKIKHLKPTQQSPKGGKISKPAPIHACKVQPVDPKTGKGTRVRYVTKDGVKRRIAVKTGSDLGVVAKVK